jgi:hypothetical protein
MHRSRFAVVAALVLLASCGQTTTPADRAEPAPPATTVNPEDSRVFCAEVARRVTPADCATYAQLAQNATRGMAAFNAPNPMRRGETHLLQLAISAPPAPPAPETPSTDTPPPAPETPAEVVGQLPGETVAFKPLVGRFMRAELNGVGFDISAQSPPMQEVTPDSATTWSWAVVARTGGQRSLTLTTVVEGCTDSGECVPLRSTTQNYTVDVQVRPIDQVRDVLSTVPDWIKIVSAIIAAIAGLTAAIFALRNAFRKGRQSA